MASSDIIGQAELYEIAQDGTIEVNALAEVHDTTFLPNWLPFPVYIQGRTFQWPQSTKPTLLPLFNPDDDLVWVIFGKDRFIRSSLELFIPKKSTGSIPSILIMISLNYLEFYGIRCKHSSQRFPIFVVQNYA